MAKSVVAQWANWITWQHWRKILHCLLDKDTKHTCQDKSKSKMYNNMHMLQVFDVNIHGFTVYKEFRKGTLKLSTVTFSRESFGRILFFIFFFFCSLFSILLCNWILDTRWNTYIIRKFKKSRHYCVTHRSKLLEGRKWNPNYKFNFRQCSDLHLHIFLLGKPIKLGQPGTLYRQKDTDVVQRLKTWNTSHRGKKNYFSHKKGFSGINKELP